jgi:hypothetical protein
VICLPDLALGKAAAHRPSEMRERTSRDDQQECDPVHPVVPALLRSAAGWTPPRLDYVRHPRNVVDAEGAAEPSGVLAPNQQRPTLTVGGGDLLHKDFFPQAAPDFSETESSALHEVSGRMIKVSTETG